MKNKIMLCLLSSLFLIFAVGCGTKKSDTKGNLNILIDVKDAKSTDLIQKLAEDYKGKNPDTNVIVSAALGGSTASEIDKGKADLLFTTRRTMISLAGKGRLADTKNLFEDNKIDERYNKIVKSYGRYNDKEYGLPLNLSPLEVYYNTDALKKLGLTAPKDTAGLYSLLSALNSKSVEIPVFVSEEKYFRSDLFSFLVNNSVSVNKFDAVFENEAEAYKSIDMKVPFDTLKDLVRKNIVSKYSFINGSDTAVVKLNKGDIPVIIGAFANMNELTGSNIEVYQNFSGGIVPVISDSIMSVPVNSQNGKQVESFIKYIFSDETQKKLNEMGYSSNNKSLNKDAKGLAAVVNKQLGDADEKNIIFTDSIPEKMLDALEGRLELILSGKFTDNEWNEVINSAH